jgi:hypothetical protein
MDVADPTRRSMFGIATTAGVAAASFGALTLMRSTSALASGITGWINVVSDYGATGNGTTDDTTALQNAINAGSSAQKPVFVPPGTYKTTRSLTIPSYTMIIGSNPGMGFSTISHSMVSPQQ